MEASSFADPAARSAPQRADHDHKRSVAGSAGGSPSLMARAGFRTVHEGARADGDGFTLVRQRRAQALAGPAKAARAHHLGRSAVKRTVAASRPASQVVAVPAKASVTPGPLDRGRRAYGADSKQPASAPRAGPSIGALLRGPSIGALLRAKADGMPMASLAELAEALVRRESEEAGEAFFAELGAALVRHAGTHADSLEECRELVAGALRALDGREASAGHVIRGACAAAVQAWHAQDEETEILEPADLLLDRVAALLAALGGPDIQASQLGHLLAGMDDARDELPDDTPGMPPDLHDSLLHTLCTLLGGPRMAKAHRGQVLAHLLSPRRALDETRRSHELSGLLTACEGGEWSVAEHQAVLRDIASSGLPADAVGSLAWTLGLHGLCESPEEAGLDKDGDHLVLDAQADPQAVFTAILRCAAQLEEPLVVGRLVEGLHAVAELLGAGPREADSPVRALRAAMRACAPQAATQESIKALARSLARADARGDVATQVARFSALEWDD